MNGTRPGRTVPSWVLGANGALLVVLCSTVAWMARDFTYGTAMLSRPILFMVFLLMAAGVAYWVAIASLRSSPFTRWRMGWVFAVGAAMRLVMSLSQPILEDDYYRYLWDGALAAHGINPYTVLPESAQSGAGPGNVDIARLAEEAGIVLERVNHPELGTIYPPGAQGAFALAHRIAPWRVGGLRALYAGVDCAVFLLLAALLRRFARSPLLVAVYWWNPLVVKETYNSVHMDVLIVPWILVALLLVSHRRWVPAAAALAVATAIKLWPVLLLPPLLAAARHTPRKMAAAALVFLAAGTLLLAPMLSTAALGEEAGLVAYGQFWEMNDALFMVFPWLLEQVVPWAGFSPDRRMLHLGGKVIAAGLVLLVVWLVTRRTIRQPGPDATVEGAMAASWLWIAAALFLLSPTQFPWYFVWMAPLLALAPSRGLLLLTVMLPVYYLKFFFEARGQVNLFHNGVVWLEYAPVWLLLLWDGVPGRRVQGID